MAKTDFTAANRFTPAELAEQFPCNCDPYGIWYHPDEPDDNKENRWVVNGDDGMAVAELASYKAAQRLSGALKRPAKLGAFLDSRVILVKHGDERLPGLSKAPVFIQQEADGPVYVAIAATASDDALKAVHAQYKVPFNDLLQFRGACAAERIEAI